MVTRLSAVLLGTLAVAALALSGPANAAETKWGGGNLRTGPGIYYAVITHVPQGQYVRVSSCQNWGSWCRVRVSGMRGWMHRSRLVLDSSDGGAGEQPVGSGNEQPVGSGNDGGVAPSNKGTHTIIGPVIGRPGYCYAIGLYRRTVIIRCQWR